MRFREQGEGTLHVSRESHTPRGRGGDKGTAGRSRGKKGKKTWSDRKKGIGKGSPGRDEKEGGSHRH